MASLSFTRADVQAILAIVDESRESGATKEGDYLRYCNALKFLHERVDMAPQIQILPTFWSQPQPPPLTTTTTAAETADARVARVARAARARAAANADRLLCLQRQIVVLQNQRSATRPRLTDRHKVSVVQRILAYHNIPPPQENPDRCPRVFINLALPLLPVDVQRDLPVLYRQERDLCHQREMQTIDGRIASAEQIVQRFHRHELADRVRSVLDAEDD